MRWGRGRRRNTPFTVDTGTTGGRIGSVTPDRPLPTRTLTRGGTASGSRQVGAWLRGEKHTHSSPTLDSALLGREQLLLFSKQENSAKAERAAPPPHTSCQEAALA